ncbi:BrnT family toxin [Phyllobacterium meliloti]|uniref:BrnT family toxin n=1 Tax=Phyllobacterium meliloti TaxID=555317 RepID=UPI000DE090BE|nr:BrnT family toxin [Phyllobacterium sp. T1293]UGX88177.1 BrnT family toxin [Phyllobacterium sp. T1293]
MSRFEWNEDKAKSNIRKHGVTFELADRFEFCTAMEQLDDRENYREERTVAIGFIGNVLFTLTYTERGSKIRVISLRKSSTSEIKRYAREYD